MSVRKRVIQIFSDVCLSQPDFEKIPEICIKMIGRIDDEETIKVSLVWLRFVLNDILKCQDKLAKLLGKMLSYKWPHL